jgi:hypothetical protein
VGVDCRDVRALFDPPIGGGFIEGFVVLVVRRQTPLDVVSVVTARHRRGTDPDVESINIYDVNPKAIVPPPGSG